MDSLFIFSYCGLLTGCGFFFIIMPPPGGAIPLTFGRSSPCICLRNVSGSGMPGVGVAPGLIFTFASFGSGIPGVGVAPFGRLGTPFEGIPTVELAEGGIGEVENSGPTLALIFVTTTFDVVFEFVCGLDPQAKTKHEITNKAISENILNIKTSKIKFKMAVPVRRLRPRGAATAFEPARAGFKRIRKVSNCHRLTVAKQ